MHKSQFQKIAPHDWFCGTGSHIKKVLGWPSVKSEDVKSLQSYSLVLCGCWNITDAIYYMEGLEMPSNLKTIIMKLPCKLREKWRTVACELMERLNHRARFKVIEHQDKMSSGPLVISRVPNLYNRDLNLD